MKSSESNIGSGHRFVATGMCLLALLVGAVKGLTPAQARGLADHVLSKTRRTKGVGAVFPSGDGALPVAIAQRSEYIVFGGASDNTARDAARHTRTARGHGPSSPSPHSLAPMSGRTTTMPPITIRSAARHSTCFPWRFSMSNGHSTG